MALKRCENGHYFDPGKHTSCPSCGVQMIDMPTRPKAVSTRLPAPLRPRPKAAPDRAPPTAPPARTMARRSRSA